MNSNYDFCLTPAYCLYNGAAVLEQNGAYIKFLVEDKSNTLLCGRLSRAFENHVANVRHFKDCPENFQRLIKIDFVNGSRSQVRKCLLKLYKATDTDSLSDAKLLRVVRGICGLYSAGVFRCFRIWMKTARCGLFTTTTTCRTHVR